MLLLWVAGCLAAVLAAAGWLIVALIVGHCITAMSVAYSCMHHHACTTVDGVMLNAAFASAFASAASAAPAAVAFCRCCCCRASAAAAAAHPLLYALLQGVAFYMQVTQFDAGEYPYANNPQVRAASKQC
jgi:hypothetical protein